jgi:hypothetical protein
VNSAVDLAYVVSLIPSSLDCHPREEFELVLTDRDSSQNNHVSALRQCRFVLPLHPLEASSGTVIAHLGTSPPHPRST